MTKWYFIRHAPGSLSAFTERQMQAFLLGRLSLQGDEARLVHYVGLSVYVDRGVAMAVESVWFARCPVRDDGTLDQQEMLARANARVDLHRRLKTQGIVWPPGQDVVDARDVFAARRVQHETRWEPTEEDLEALRELVNQRAGWAML